MKWLFGIVVVFVAAVVAVSFVGRSIFEEEIQSASSTAATYVVSATVSPESVIVSTTVSSESVIVSTTVSPESTLVSVTTTDGVSRFSIIEIGLHNTTASCWLLISARVYDVSTYLIMHPAGTRTITPWCGKESTVAFATEDGSGTHSSRAYNDLAEYEIGILAS